MPFEQSKMQDEICRQMMIIIMIMIIMMQTILPLILGDLKACKLCGSKSCKSKTKPDDGNKLLKCKFASVLPRSLVEADLLKKIIKMMQWTQCLHSMHFKDYFGFVLVWSRKWEALSS